MSSTNNTSECKIINGRSNLIVCFGGMALCFCGVLPFEFLRYLQSNFTDKCDLVFFTDKHQCWYHKGLDGITTNVDETVAYINNITSAGNYEKVIFIGTSMGGYAAILFGSLCNNVSNVISFIPQTKVRRPVDLKFADIKPFINNNTQYLLCADVNVQNVNDPHHRHHCEYIDCFSNVKIHKFAGCNLKEVRDNGFIKNTITEILSKS
jgi:hypothetical protein